MLPISAVNVSIAPPVPDRVESENGGRALYRPERRDRADGVRGRARPRAGHRQVRAPPEPRERQHDGDEDELADLHADVEEEQRERHRMLREADLGEGAGESE